MNPNLYRIVFNPVRAAQLKLLPVLTRLACGASLLAIPLLDGAYAQIIADPNAAANRRPTIISATGSPSPLSRDKQWLTAALCRLAQCLESPSEGRGDGGITLQGSKVNAMREELIAVWQRSAASKDEQVKQLEDWCHRAESSGIEVLANFSRKLRCYA